MLKILHLAAAKAQLGDTTSRNRNVTSIAVKYGFFHLGRFYQEFKAQYGMLPSELLNKHIG